MANRKDPATKVYYFVDIELATRNIIGWGTETGNNLEVKLGNGCYRLFISTGQYNKLVRQLEKSSS